MNRGFTIVELIISIAIFVSMTTLIVAKYGAFNQSTLLTDTAYDTALVIRLAQTYGLSVKNSGQAGATANFSTPYGVEFTTGSNPCGGATSDYQNFTLFADSYPSTADGYCGVSDANITSYALSRGATVNSLCAGTDATSCHQSSGSMLRLDLSFVRPDPQAVVCGVPTQGSPSCSYTYAELVLSGPDGSTRTIVIRQNGQISVQ